MKKGRKENEERVVEDGKEDEERRKWEGWEAKEDGKKMKKKKKKVRGRKRFRRFGTWEKWESLTMREGEKDSPCVENRVEGKKRAKTRGGQEGRRRGGVKSRLHLPLPPASRPAWVEDERVWQTFWDDKGTERKMGDRNELPVKRRNPVIYSIEGDCSDSIEKDKKWKKKKSRCQKRKEKWGNKDKITKLQTRDDGNMIKEESENKRTRIM